MNSDMLVGMDCTSLGDCYAKGGWFWLVAFGVSLLLRWYQSGQGEAFAAHISPNAVWSRLALPLKIAISVVLSCVATTLVGLHAGQSWWLALLSGIPAAVAAAGIDRQMSSVKRAVTANDATSIRTEPPKVF